MKSPLYLLFLLCSVVAARADRPLDLSDQTPPEELKHLSLEQLSQIEVVTPSKEPVPAFRSPVAIYVITGEEIQRSGATTIPEALRLAPGVEVARIDSNKWSIGIRGFGTRFSRGVLVLIDGRTVYSTLLAGTYWEVQDTMIEDVDRIEVIRGPGGTIWGPNAVNGVINIITKNSRDTHGVLATAGGGEPEEQGFGSVRYGGSHGDDLNYRVYAKGYTRGPEHHPDNRNFDDWRDAQAGFRLDWQPDEGDKVAVSGDLYAQEAGQRVQAVSYTAPYQQNIDANADNTGGNLLARWTRTISDHDDIQVQAYYDRTNRFEANFAEIRNTFDIDYLQRHQMGRQEISWGLGARFSLAHDIEVVSGLTFLPPKRTDELFTGFLQDQISLVDNRLALILGTKLLRTNFTDVGLEPSARLLWTPTSKQTFWTAFTHALRTPSDAEENFYLSGFVGVTPTGVPFLARFNANHNFAPEQLNGYEIGYRRLIDAKLSVDFAGFYNHHHDLFDEEFAGPVFLEQNPPPEHYLLPAQFGNGLLGTTKGFEIAPEFTPFARWRLRGSYSFLQMDVRPAPSSGDVGTSPGINGGSPKHEVTIQSDLDLSKKFSFNCTYRYVSQLWAQGVPSYSTGDTRLDWRASRHVEISLVGRNLFQPYHFEFAGDPGPLVGIERSGYIKLTWMD